MGWKCYTHNTVDPGAPNEETAALDYRVEWTMNNPATATVVVNDDSGAKSQTYGTGYLGKSYLRLEQPAATQIFRGRIVAAEPNPRDGIVTLQAEDWLSQLNDRLVIFDTREILGNSYREARALPPAGQLAFYTAAGPTYNMRILTDEVGHWVNDQWNGAAGTHYLVFPTAKHMGHQTDILYAGDDATGSTELPLTTDTPNGFLNTYAEDGTYHSIADVMAGGGSIYVDYDFSTLAKNSTLVDSIDAITVHATARAYGAAAVTYRIYLYDHDTGVWRLLRYNPSGALPEDEMHTWTFEAPISSSGTFAGYFDADGETHVRFSLLSTGAGALNIDVDQVYITVDYTVDTAHTEVHTINDTIHTDGTPPVNRVEVADDIVTDGLISYWPFSICRVLTHSVTDLVTAYDELFTLDAATDVVASTNCVTRHYHYVAPLAILRDLAKVDSTDFWLDADYDLHWLDAYAVAGAPTWSDPGLGGTYEVLHWDPAGVRLKDVINECFVEGYTSGTYKVQDDYSNAASIASYGQRSEYVNNPEICRTDEALLEATARVNRRKDPPIHVTALLNGYNTRSLGEVVVIHSDKLNIQSVNYVITRKVYDSASATSLFDLVPRPADAPRQLNVRAPLSQLMQRVDERINQLETRIERGSRYTEVWS